MNDDLFNLFSHTKDVNFNTMPLGIQTALIAIVSIILIPVLAILLLYILDESTSIYSDTYNFFIGLISILVIGLISGNIFIYQTLSKPQVKTTKQWSTAIEKANKSKDINLNDHPLLFNNKSKSTNIIKPLIDKNLSLDWVYKVYNTPSNSNKRNFSIKNGELQLKLSLIKGKATTDTFDNKSSDYNIYDSYFNTKINLVIDENSNVSIIPLDPTSYKLLKIESKLKDMNIKLQTESIKTNVNSNNEISVAALTDQNKLINISTESNSESNLSIIIE